MCSDKHMYKKTSVAWLWVVLSDSSLSNMSHSVWLLANRKIDKIAGGNAIPSQHKKSGIIVFTRFFLLRVTAHPRLIPLILLYHSYHTELDMLHVKSPVPYSVLQSRLPIPLIARQRGFPAWTNPFLTVVDKSAVQCGKVAQDQKAICQHYESWGESRGWF